MTRMPALFLGHGAPPLLDDALWVSELAAWGRALPRPAAILVFSAHWVTPEPAIGATAPRPLVYDFSGFPQRFYALTYPAPGAPALAARVRALLAARGVAHVDDANRGLDHGVYVPLLCMYPDADVPVLQVSLPGLDPRRLFALGQALAPLRDEGALLVGSGFLTHNLRTLGGDAPPAWATAFDAWALEALTRMDIDALLDWEARAPAARTAHPTTEHFAPLFVTLGAAADAAPSFPITGFWMGSLSKRSLQLG